MFVCLTCLGFTGLGWPWMALVCLSAASRFEAELGGQAADALFATKPCTKEAEGDRASQGAQDAQSNTKHDFMISHCW